MEQERPYTETEPETAAETVETVPETAETPAETGEPAPKKPRESFSAASAASFPTHGARSTATAARGASARGRSRCSHC